MNRARTTANRRKALEEHLGAIGMSFADYEALERKAKEPFYKDGDEIIIPELHVTSFLVVMCDEARSAIRSCEPNQVRSRFIVTPWSTGKTKCGWYLESLRRRIGRRRPEAVESAWSARVPVHLRLHRARQH
jgi:hypothetical protein